MTTAIKTMRIELCYECVTVDANGIDSLPDVHDWTGFLPEWDGWVFGPDYTGMCDSGIEGGCGACDDCFDAHERHADGHFVRPGTPCGGCGTTLGGGRWAYIALAKL